MFTTPQHLLLYDRSAAGPIVFDPEHELCLYQGIVFVSVNRVRTIAMEVLAQAADLEAANDLKEEAIKELIHYRLEVVFVPHDCRLADISRPDCFA